MKKPTADDLRRRALKLGAEVVIDGKGFNARRNVVPVRSAQEPPEATAEPIAAAAAPSEIPAGKDTFTRQEVEAMLAALETRVVNQMADKIAAATAAARAGATETPGFFATGFTPKYKADGSIDFVGVQYERLQ